MEDPIQECIDLTYPNLMSLVLIRENQTFFVMQSVSLGSMHRAEGVLWITPLLVDQVWLYGGA